MTNNTIKSVLKEAQEKLITVSDSPALDTEILLSHCLEKNRTYLHTWPEHIVEAEPLACFQSFLEKRLTDYPIAYLIGTKPFWSLDLIVTPDVLIPRPETELLVETALDKIRQIKHPKILDLGTGSGAIALALASERPDATIIATDVSTEALQIAKKNADKYQLSGIVEFIKSDWFSQIIDRDFDLIVSNPPYIAPNDPHLTQSIRYEPQQALIADSITSGNGMKDIQTIISQSQNYLKENSYLMIEHGYQQGSATQLLFKTHCYSNNQIIKDISGNDRLSIVQK